MLECARIEELKLEQQQQAKEMILTRRTAVAKVKVHSSVQDQPYDTNTVCTCYRMSIAVVPHIGQIAICRATSLDLL